MPSGVSFSNRHIEIHTYAEHHKDLTNSLNHFFDDLAPEYIARWALMTKPEVSARLVRRLEEVELTSSLALLSGVEALFRMDYLNRVKKRNRDPLSRAFRKLFKEYQHRVSLEDTLLSLWKQYSDADGSVISSLRGAFKYRHWLAHGRYWEPKLRQQYNYSNIYTLALAVKSGFPFDLN
ncbi:hypothetical protein [Rhizobium leguminosarum]|uniref:hypothetical protein n=1 Tax=Rhizobium leguminosarum TaxID=384 RepID=UPI003F95D2F7